MLQPLRHPDFQKLDDPAFDLAAKQYAARTGAVQFLTELIERLRGFSWWNPQDLRASWGAADRMIWLKERPDIRQRITTALTGLAPRAARNKTPEFQASLIDSVIEDGDVTITAFEEAFYPIEYALYAPAPTIWKMFRDRMPWRDETPQHRQLVEWILEEFLATRSRAYDWKRKAILSPLALRSAIAPRVWHLHVPIDLRIAVDEARLERERAKPTEPFHAAHELQIVTPQILAMHLPLRELLRIFDAAEREMGLAPPTTSPSVAALAAVTAPATSSVSAMPAVAVHGVQGGPGASNAGAASAQTGSAPWQQTARLKPSEKGLAASQAQGSVEATTVPPAGEPEGTDIPVNDEDFAFDDA